MTAHGRPDQVQVPDGLVTEVTGTWICTAKICKIPACFRLWHLEAETGLFHDRSVCRHPLQDEAVEQGLERAA